MRVFVGAAVGALLLAGCAPFEHGHYSNDVSYRNTVGDPPGTPLVYRHDDSATKLAGHPSGLNKATKPWLSDHHQSGSFASLNSYAAPSQVFAAPTSFVQPVQQTFAAPTSFAQPIQQVFAAPTSFAQPIQQAFAAPTSFVQPVQQTYVPPTYTQAQPVAQSYVAQQQFIQPAQQVTFAAAPAPVQNHSNVLATSYGGPRIDAEGYAICDIPWPGHAAHQKPQFKARF